MPNDTLTIFEEPDVAANIMFNRDCQQLTIDFLDGHDLILDLPYIKKLSAFLNRIVADSKKKAKKKP